MCSGTGRCSRSPGSIRSVASRLGDEAGGDVLDHPLARLAPGLQRPVQLEVARGDVLRLDLGAQRQAGRAPRRLGLQADGRVPVDQPGLADRDRGEIGGDLARSRSPSRSAAGPPAGRAARSSRSPTRSSNWSGARSPCSVASPVTRPASVRSTPCSGSAGSIRTSSAAARPAKPSAKLIRPVAASRLPSASTVAGSPAWSRSNASSPASPSTRRRAVSSALRAMDRVIGHAVLEHQLAARDLQLDRDSSAARSDRPTAAARAAPRARSRRAAPPAGRSPAEPRRPKLPSSAAAQHQARRPRRERDRRQHAGAGSAPSRLMPTSISGSSTSSSPPRPLDQHVRPDQLDHPIVAEAQQRVADLDPKPSVSRLQRPLHIRGEPGELDRAARQPRAERRDRDDRERREHGERRNKACEILRITVSLYRCPASTVWPKTGKDRM